MYLLYTSSKGKNSFLSEEDFVNKRRGLNWRRFDDYWSSSWLRFEAKYESVETRIGLCDNEIHFISKRERRPLGELSLTWKNNVTRQEGNLYQ